MPIYEYMCTDCQHHFECIQKIHEAPITQCPVCKKETAQKQMSAAGFQLKGTGWYVTDFKKGGQNTDNNATKKTETTPKSTD